MKQQNRHTGIGLYIFLIVLFIIIWYAFSGSKTSNYSMNSFKKDLKNEDVTSVTIKQNSEVPTGSAVVHLKADTNDYTIYLSDVNAFQDYLDDQDFTHYTVNDVPHDGWFLQFLPLLLVIALMFILFTMIISRSRRRSAVRIHV